MGSTFGKVRKYNVSHSGDPTTYRLSSGFDEDGKYLDFSQASVKDLKSFRKSTHQESPRFYNPKGKEPNPPMAIFSTAYPEKNQPGQLGFGVSEDFLIPSNFSIPSIKKEMEIKAPKSYEFTDQQLREVIEKVLRNSSHGSNLPSGSYRPAKPDSAMDPNPKPHQKFYSAEDISKLLRPLNMINSKLNAFQSYQTFLNQESQRNSRQNTLNNQWTSQSTPHVCCNHKEYDMRTHETKSLRTPPPYSSSHFNYAPQSNFNANYNNHSFSENFLQRQSASDSLFTPDVKYNTIHNDGRIPLHLRKEFNNFSNSRQPPIPVQEQQVHRKMSRSINLPTNLDGLFQLQRDEPNNNNSKIRDVKYNKPVQEPLKRTAVFDQNVPVNSQLYSSLLSQNRYTIPEEGSWPPPFGYNSVRSTGYRKNY